MTTAPRPIGSSRALAAVLVAQFFSALADNAALVIAIALVRMNGAAGREPLLQEAFVVPFLLLAPFAGPVADGYPKGRVMLLANAVKLAGAAAMLAGLNPLIAYMMIGAGATLYSPAKYGILPQLVEPEGLVRANSLLEGSTIAAILLGVLLGGWLADHALSRALGGVILFYLAAAGANLFIPFLRPERPEVSLAPSVLLPDFFASIKSLVADPDARFSLFGTSLFWGCGATLRLLLFAWVPVALLMTNNQTPANLMGIVSIGIVFGASAAGLWISLKTANRALIGGVLLGPVLLALAGVTSYTVAALLMVLIGFCGGLLVVPLNALLQERGYESVGAGNALAVQNLFENLTMLLFVGLYSRFLSHGVPAVRSVRYFGLLLLILFIAAAVGRVVRFPRMAGRPALGLERTARTLDQDR